MMIFAKVLNINKCCVVLCFADCEREVGVTFGGHVFFQEVTKTFGSFSILVGLISDCSEACSCFYNNVYSCLDNPV